MPRESRGFHPAYFETRFLCSGGCGDSGGLGGLGGNAAASAHDRTTLLQTPKFAIITAAATTGEQWSVRRTARADQRLRTYLHNQNALICELTGYSPHTGHAEKGYACTLSTEDACRVGRVFRQDAIYVIENDNISVVDCNNSSRTARLTAGFRRRMD